MVINFIKNIFTKDVGVNYDDNKSGIETNRKLSWAKINLLEDKEALFLKKRKPRLI